MITEQRVVLKHEFLDANIETHLLDSARAALMNTCSEESGYVIGVKRLLRIVQNRISNVNGDVIFILELEIETFLPQVGMECDAEVYLVVERGVVVIVGGCQKMLLMPTSLNGYKITQDRLTRTQRTIAKGDTLRVAIDGVKFNKNSFSVFGRIAE